MVKKQDRSSKKVYTAPVVVRRKPLNHVTTGPSYLVPSPTTTTTTTTSTTTTTYPWKYR